MHVGKKMVLVLVLCAGLALPPWVGAEEPPPSAENRQEQDAPPPVAGNAAPEQDPDKSETFASIELDRFIEQEQKAIGNGKKMIKMAVPVSFEARMKRLPEQRQMEYIYTALELIGVSPMPEVHHRMFIESGEGRIIPVYVEQKAVARLNSGLKEEEKAVFRGYHVYSYAKGPAIMVVDFAAVQ